MTVRILVTGSRNLEDYNLVRWAIAKTLDEFGKDAVVVHGGARGADYLAGMAAQALDVPVEVHKADWENEGKAAGILRNRRMVDLGADVCLAFPIGESRGTRDCMYRAERAGIPVRVIPVD